MPLEDSVIHSEYRNEDEILFMAQSSHPDNSTLVAIFVITVVTLLMIALITWKLCSLCNKWYKRRDELRPPCLNCNLIAMGEAVSYADGSCPQCGNNT
ncbi:hypothetical protein TCAL_15191 [Tigriopus californicus]|uniref:Uncharacterized protein n=1 Tax=Tigriopus californicus TaxID=6832 RepID=A0A553NEH8_TIGCA|nr:hypothetical protein TCAL_15191 [Tigriopus californicus]